MESLGGFQDLTGLSCGLPDLVLGTVPLQEKSWAR